MKDKLPDIYRNCLPSDDMRKQADSAYKALKDYEIFKNMNWIKKSERLPDNKQFISFIVDGQIMSGMYKDGKLYCADHDGEELVVSEIDISFVSHWMIPELSEGE